MMKPPSFFDRFAILFLGLLLLAGTPLLAQEAGPTPEADEARVEQTPPETEPPPTIDDRINAFMEPFTNAALSVIFFSITIEEAQPMVDDDGQPVVGPEGDPVMLEPVTVPVVVVWLIIGALIFTIYFKFANVRLFTTAVNVVRGRYTDPEEEAGEVSHFQALTAALSATVGLGNIAGVAIAITLGGPGATFWMILAGLLGMSSKFVECTLGVKYRQIGEDGTVYGGPMYYLRDGLAKKGGVFKAAGRALAVLFALCCIMASLGGGNMFQANQAFAQFQKVTGGADSWIAGSGWIFGLVLAVLVALVIIGGIKSIARVTARLVPVMCAVYVVTAILILLMNLTEIPVAFGEILKGAFAPEAVGGGFIGALIIGFQRAAFSNEAGIGSAPIAHSAVRTNSPASEGIVALLEPFIDTVVVCTMTALVIVITGQYKTTGIDGVELTSMAFAANIAWFPYILALAVVLFAFSTMISWSYYGQQAWYYLFGRGKAAELTFKLIFCTFVVIGSAMSLGNVVGFSDAAIFAMCFPNLIGLYLLLPEVRTELKAYMAKIRLIEQDIAFKERLHDDEDVEGK
ncbi:MAG: alanine/glycine:cation symporter family protein [Opitutales bacterium]